jgi:hypothetical protein
VARTGEDPRRDAADRGHRQFARSPAATSYRLSTVPATGRSATIDRRPTGRSFGLYPAVELALHPSLVSPGQELHHLANRGALGTLNEGTNLLPRTQLTRSHPIVADTLSPRSMRVSQSLAIDHGRRDQALETAEDPAGTFHQHSDTKHGSAPDEQHADQVPDRIV